MGLYHCSLVLHTSLLESFDNKIEAIKSEQHSPEFPDEPYFLGKILLTIVFHLGLPYDQRANYLRLMKLRWREFPQDPAPLKIPIL